MVQAVSAVIGDLKKKCEERESEGGGGGGGGVEERVSGIGRRPE